MSERLKNSFLLFFLALLLISCAPSPSNEHRDPEQAFRTMIFKAKAAEEIASQGYTAIRLGSYAMETCASDEVFGMTFTAQDAQGSPVQGSVCATMIRGEEEIEFIWRVAQVGRQ